MSTRKDFYEGENELYIVTTAEDGTKSLTEAEFIETQEFEDEEEEIENEPEAATPAASGGGGKRAYTFKKHEGKIGCDECGSKGHRHKKGCPREGAAKRENAILSPQEADDLNAQERKYHAFKAPITEKQYKEIRLRRIEEVPMSDILEEFECSEPTVTRVWAASTYDSFLREERRAQ